MTTLQKLSTYGPVFQVKVLGALLTQRQFLINIIDSLDSEYFESSAHKWVVEYVQKYFGEYHTTPTVETMSIEVKKIENEEIGYKLIALIEQKHIDRIAVAFVNDTNFYSNGESVKENI